MSNFVSIESKPAQGASATPAQPENKAAAAQGLQVTDRAVKRIRVAMEKEGVSPTEGGLRLGVMGGGCSGLSYSIKFDSHPRERDRIYEFDGRARLRRSQVVRLSARHDAGLRRDADAAGLQLHQSELLALLRLRFILLIERNQSP